MKSSIRRFSNLPKQLFEISNFYLLLFTPMLFIVSLLWFFMILPLAIWQQVIMKIWRRIFGSSKIPVEIDFTHQSRIFHSTKASDFSQKDSRELDLVVYGATGFTGQLICKYLRDNYGSSSQQQLKWAIGGRSKSKLEEVLNKLQLKDVEVIVAESENGEQLNKMCNRSRVILSTVGPYALYGTSLVNVCAAYGTDYVDITGEVDWVQYCTHQFSALAKQTNARIVNLCGHDSVPYDLIAYMLADKLNSINKEHLQSLTIFVEAKGGFSGGTLASLLGIIDRKQYNMPKVPLDHYKTLPGNQEPHAVESQFLGPYFINYCSTYKQFVMFSIMGSCNFSVIRRSNSMLGYSLQSPKSTLLYKESMVPEGLLMSLYTYSLLVFTSTCLLFSPTRYLLTKFLLPKPGQGPSEKMLNEGFMNIIGRAQGSKGTYANCSFSISKEDPGYKGTGRMLAESALCFILNKNEITAKGGFHTPASAFGKVLMNRLQKTGTAFSYFSTNSNNNSSSSSSISSSKKDE